MDEILKQKNEEVRKLAESLVGKCIKVTDHHGIVRIFHVKSFDSCTFNPIYTLYYLRGDGITITHSKDFDEINIKKDNNKMIASFSRLSFIKNKEITLKNLSTSFFTYEVITSAQYYKALLAASEAFSKLNFEKK